MMVAGSAATAEPAPTTSETKLVELLVQPESWFIEQLGGKLVVVDGQTLDPKIQYVLARDAAAPKPSGPAVDPAATPEGRAALREGADRSWTFRTRVTAPMAETIDREVKGRGGPIPVRVSTPPATAGALPASVSFHVRGCGAGRS